MSVAEEITKAIGAHGMWKNRLKDAIAAGKSDFSVEKVQPDNLCDFGKWLHALPESERSSERWKKVQALHATFHKEAARILGLALAGKKDEASPALMENSEFANRSAELTTLMMKWRKEIS